VSISEEVDRALLQALVCREDRLGAANAPSLSRRIAPPQAPKSVCQHIKIWAACRKLPLKLVNLLRELPKVD
jgi:hypothetical protein